MEFDFFFFLFYGLLVAFIREVCFNPPYVRQWVTGLVSCPPEDLPKDFVKITHF